MNVQPSIPQYPLLDAAGKPTSFRLEMWAKKEAHYDYEKPHRHHFNELLVFFKGGGTHDIDFTTYQAHSRSVHFVASDNVHLTLRSKASSGCSLLFANDYFSHELIAQLPFSKTTPVLQLSAIDFPIIRQLIDNINVEYTAKQMGYEAIIQAHMQALMLHLQRMYRNQYPEQEEKSTKPELVNRFMQLIQQHYIDHYNVVQYAEKLSISSKHLIELCKTHTGQTPLQHIRAYTISEAKKLLYHIPLSVKEVAYQLHFEDPANFSKYFKSATGYTPAEYREGIR